MDLLAIITASLMFALAFVYILGCERLKGDRP